MGDETAAAAGSSFLASDADRELVIGSLRTALTHGSLTEDEYCARVLQASGSRTYGELAAATAGIVPGPGAMPGRRAANLETALWAMGVFGAIPPAMMVAGYLANSEKVAAIGLVLFAIDFLIALMGGTIALGTVIDTQLKKHYSAQPPLPPG